MMSLLRHYILVWNLSITAEISIKVICNLGIKHCLDCQRSNTYKGQVYRLLWNTEREFAWTLYGDGLKTYPSGLTVITQGNWILQTPIPAHRIPTTNSFQDMKHIPPPNLATNPST